jgi:hypothetical protein
VKQVRTKVGQNRIILARAEYQLIKTCSVGSGRRNFGFEKAYLILKLMLSSLFKMVFSKAAWQSMSIGIFTDAVVTKASCRTRGLRNRTLRAARRFLGAWMMERVLSKQPNCYRRKLEEL